MIVLNKDTAPRFFGLMCRRDRIVRESHTRNGPCRTEESIYYSLAVLTGKAADEFTWCVRI